MSSEPKYYFTSYLSANSEPPPSVSCINCRLEQSISIVRPYPDHRFSRNFKFKKDTDALKFGDFIKQIREIKCRKCDEIIYSQTLVLVVHDGWMKIAGTQV